MAKIPILKLNNGNTNYYPFSVGEATVTTHSIEVKNDIGSYKAGDKIPAVTTLDEIITNIFNGEGSSIEESQTPGQGSSSEGGNYITDIPVDGITITKNDEGQIQIARLTTDQIEDFNTKVDEKVNSIKFDSTKELNIGTIEELANAVKEIFIKLGCVEDNIIIDTSRVTKVTD